MTKLLFALLQGRFDLFAVADLFFEPRHRERQLARALDHAVLQLILHAPQRFFGLVALGDIERNPQ